MLGEEVQHISDPLCRIADGGEVASVLVSVDLTNVGSSLQPLTGLVARYVSQTLSH